MDIIFVLASICLVLFMFLAVYDGVYLHLWKYELFNQEESRFEHKTHTIRAVLFPLIVWLLFINSDVNSFVIGLVLVLLDLIVLGIDAYSEKESRKFMGGLPKWEYIIHLFSNTFHFAAIVLIIATRLKFSQSNLVYVIELADGFGKQLFDFVATNALPGAILLAFIHLGLVSNFGQQIWKTHRPKIACC